MAYTTIKNPPSNFIPYPSNTIIKCRPLTYGEVTDFSELSGNELDIINIFNDNEIIYCENIDFWDLTLGDWMFLLLSIMSTSFFRITYSVTRECSKCKGEVKTLDLQVQGVSPTVKGELKAKVTPAEISFKQIDEEDVPDLPVIVDTSDESEVEVDFFRMRHYKEKLENPSKDELSLITSGKDVRELSLNDVQTIGYVRSLMDHGADTEVEATCPLCGKKETVQVTWEGIDFIPFRPDEGSTRNRIRFGKRTKSTVDSDKKSTSSSGSSSIPRLSKVSEQK